MILALLRREGVGSAGRCLDIGCGPGGNLKLFAPLEPVLTVGLDLSPLALDYARQEAPRSSLVRADIMRRLPFQDDAFDVVTMFNVLYHEWVSSEATVLHEVSRILRPNGVAVLTEPAFPGLAREMDDIGMARRRYLLSEFRPMCREAGFDILLGSYFNSFGAALLFTRKRLLTMRSHRNGQAAGSPPDMQPINKTLNELLYRAAMLEAHAIVHRLPVPMGTTLICLVRKRTAQAAASSS